MIRAKYKSIKTEILVVYGLGFLFVIFSMIVMSEFFSYSEKRHFNEEVSMLKATNYKDRVEARLSRLMWLSTKMAKFVADDISEKKARILLSDFAVDADINYSVLLKEKNKVPIEEAVIENDTLRVATPFFLTYLKKRELSIVASLPKTLGEFRKSKLYQNNKESKHTCIYITTDKKKNNPQLWIVSPVLSGNFNGIFALNINTKFLLSTTKDNDYSSWDCYLSDSYKNIVATSRILNTNKKNIYQLFADTAFVRDNKEELYQSNFERTNIALATKLIPGGHFYFSLRSEYTYRFIIETGKITALFIILFLTFLVLSFYTKKITNPFTELREYANLLSSGRVNIDGLDTRDDELGEISTAISDLKDFFRHLIAGMQKMKEGDFTYVFDDDNGENEIAQSFNELNKALKIKQTEGEQRDVEAARNTWIASGLNTFSDMMRQHTGGINELGEKIVANLVKYLKANQSGLFLIEKNEKEIYLTMIASYAYDRKKYTKKKIYSSDGLLGACIMERKIIKLNNLPDNYIDVESGLGKSNPGNLIIVPLLFDEKILGAIEVASFKEFNEQETQFMLRVAEVTASSISIMKINQKTSDLLLQSQKQADELVEKEQIMSENVFQLQHAQQESKRNEMEIKGLLDAIKSVLMVVEYDLEGNVLDINEKVLQLFGKERDEMIGRNHMELTMMARNLKEFSEFWRDLADGKSRTKQGHFKTKDGKEARLTENFIPIFNDEGKTFKVLNIIFDNTNVHQLESEKQKLKRELERLKKEV